MSLITKVFSFDNEFFNETGKPIYMNENWFINSHYNFTSLRKRARKKRGKCAFPGCDEKCIMSHTIPESAALKKIAVNGNIYYPKYNDEIKAYEVCSISTKKASVFPGFCHKHEDLFKGFEKDGNYSDSSIILQNFRVICKYYFLMKSLRKTFESVYNKYREEIFNYQKDKIELLNNVQGINIKLEKVSDENIKHMESILDFIKANIVEIHNNDFLPYVKTLQDGKERICAILLKIPVILPVALAGKSSFENYEKKEKIKYTVHLSILPSSNSTVALFTLNKDNESHFLSILSKYSEDLFFISFIESWMIYGTDYWFINPSEWDTYSAKKKDKILKDLLLVDFFPDKKLDYTIFDGAREKLNVEID